MPINYVELKTEIDTDPRTYGLIAMRNAGDDDGIATELNKVRGSAAAVPITIHRSDVTSDELWDAIRIQDWAASGVTDPMRSYISGLAAARNPIRLRRRNGNDTIVGANLRVIFEVSGPITWTNIVNIASRFGSRAEELWGEKTLIQHTDVAKALRG